MNNLEAISPIDGRYRGQTEALVPYFSEYAFIRYRVRVEGEYLIALSENPKVGTREFTDKEKGEIRALYDLPAEEYQLAKDIEVRGHGDIPATNHDTKAVEYFMKERLGTTTLKDSLEWIHYALTSQDAINLAYALMISDAIEDVLLEALSEVSSGIATLAKDNAEVSMLSRTHGQPASPTTVGKEFAVFRDRLARQFANLTNQTLQVKLSGASGNYNAHVVSYPDVDWRIFTSDFVESLNVDRSVRFEVNFTATQVEPGDSYAELFDIFRRMNTILIDFSQDVWRYISDGWIGQKVVAGEVGSSTMPHKVNPIKFENAEGNLGIANGLFEHLVRKLPVSRLQRDLSDSTVFRSVGSALAYSLIGYKSLVGGLGRISVNKEKVAEALAAHPEILAEAYQTILRREGVSMPYEKLKELTRGKTVTLPELRTFVDNLDVSDAIKQELKAITPENYIGLAPKLAGGK